MEAGRNIYQYHFKVWPYNGIPHDSKAILEFLQDVTQCQSTLVTDHMEPGAIVVHSSEGIGRTGTFIVIDILLNLIASHGKKCLRMCSVLQKHLWQSWTEIEHYSIVYFEYITDFDAP